MKMLPYDVDATFPRTRSKPTQLQHTVKFYQYLQGSSGTHLFCSRNLHQVPAARITFFTYVVLLHAWARIPKAQGSTARSQRSGLLSHPTRSFFPEKYVIPFDTLRLLWRAGTLFDVPVYWLVSSRFLNDSLFWQPAKNS